MPQAQTTRFNRLAALGFALLGLICFFGGGLTAAWAQPAGQDKPPEWALEDNALAAEGGALGVFQLTYYWAVVERPGEGGQWPLYRPGCRRVLARVSQRVHHGLSLEGTARLADGRVVNYASRCPCARPGHQGARRCYQLLDPGRYPWGMGATLGQEPPPLEPWRSVAVDKSLIPLGTPLYIPYFKGKTGPDGRPLDGCFVAHDVGSAILGHHLDVFAGQEEWALDWRRRHPQSAVRVYGGRAYGCGGG